MQDSPSDGTTIIETIVLPAMPDRKVYPPTSVHLTSGQIEGYLFLAQLGELGGDPPGAARAKFLASIRSRLPTKASCWQWWLPTKPKQLSLLCVLIRSDTRQILLERSRPSWWAWSFYRPISEECVFWICWWETLCSVSVELCMHP